MKFIIYLSYSILTKDLNYEDLESNGTIKQTENNKNLNVENNNNLLNKLNKDLKSQENKKDKENNKNLNVEKNLSIKNLKYQQNKKDIENKKSKEIINTRRCLEIPWIKSKVRDGMFLDVWCCNVKGLLLKNYI